MCNRPEELLRHNAELSPLVVHEDEKKMWQVKTVIRPSDWAIAACSVKCGPQYARLYSLYVDPRYRRRGIAKSLIRFACDVVAEGRDVYVEIDSFELAEAGEWEPGPTDKDLRRFYLSLGFETVLGHPFSLVLRHKKQHT